MPEAYKNVPGWFNFSNFYSDMFQSLPETSVAVEVGVWMGKSLCYFAELIKESNKSVELHAVDTWDAKNVPRNESRGLPIDILNRIDEEDVVYEYFMHYMKQAQVDHLYIPHRKISWEAAELFDDQTIDFVFIDAGHSYDCIEKDIRFWFKKIKPQGIISGHDYSKQHVRMAVKEHFDMSKVDILDKRHGNVWYHKVS